MSSFAGVHNNLLYEPSSLLNQFHLIPPQKLSPTSLENQQHLSAPISGPFAVVGLKMKNIQKMCIVVEEADECIYWLDIFEETEYGHKNELKWLSAEILEILKVCSKIKSSLALTSHSLTSLAL